MDLFQKVFPLVDCSTEVSEEQLPILRVYAHQEFCDEELQIEAGSTCWFRWCLCEAVVRITTGRLVLRRI